MKKKKLYKVESWSKIVSYTIIPILIGVVGFVINNSIEDSKLNARYIEIAINILQDNNSDPSLKEYAVNLIDQFSPIKLEKDVRKKLINGELTFPNNIIQFFKTNKINENFDRIDTDSEIKKWIELNIPINAKVKSSIGYAENDIESPYAIIDFELNDTLIGKCSQWWLNGKTILKAEGFNKNGKNSGWWNFYDKFGNYEISNYYDSSKTGAESLIKTSKNGPMQVGSLDL